MIFRVETNSPLMPVGVVPPNPLELLRRDEAFRLLMAELLRKFDHVVDRHRGSQRRQRCLRGRLKCRPRWRSHARIARKWKTGRAGGERRAMACPWPT